METSREIVAASGSNLAFALSLLPREKRDDMRVFYAFCRVIDDIADDQGKPAGKRREALDHWRSVISGSETAPGVETEFRDLCSKYQLDAALLNEIIDGVAMDLTPARFATAADLEKYCYRVASAVGLVSIEIFGYRNPKTKIYAEQLGYALQWTNIMRDVGEDAGEGRIYLPLEDVEKFGITESQILDRNVPTEAFEKLMEKQSHVARGYYQEAAENLTREDEGSMKSPELMRRIYYGILRKMEQDNYRVFEKRYRLSKCRMLSEFVLAKYVL